MARNFNGSTAWIKCAIGNCNINAPSTIVALVLRGSNTTEDAVVALGASDAADGLLSLYVDTSDFLVFAADEATGAFSTSIKLLVADGWCWIGGSKASGTATPRFHRYKISTNSFTHEDGDRTLVNGATPGGSGQVRIGRMSNAEPFLWVGDMAIIALFDYVLTDAQFEQCCFSLPHLFSLAPRGLWLLDQSDTGQAVLDWTGGGANQTAITGTSVATNNPGIFNYGHEILWPSRVASVQPTRRRRLLLGVGR